jgi:PAS domain S-box-containing protein
LEKPEWHGFMEYEASVDTIIGQRRILAICTYSLSKCDAFQIMDVISNHKFAFVKRAGKWEVIAHEDTVIQKNRLTAVLEALTTGVALIDVRGGKVQSNAAFEQVWAGSRPATRFEDYPARKAWWVDTDKPVQSDEWASARAVQNGEIVVNQEIQIERLDGSRAFVLNSAAPIRDAQGRISGSAVAITDITRLKQAEEALRESESRFRALVTATSDMVYCMSPDWKTMLYLRGRDFLQDTAEPSGSWLQKYIHPDDQPYVMAAIDESIRTRSTFELEHRVLRVDGSLGWTFSRAIPIQNAAGEIVEWFGAAIDITERKRVEEQLRSHQAQLMDSQRLAKVGSWELDVTTGRTRWSDEWYRIFGLSRDVRPDFQTFLNCVHPKDREVIRETERKSHSAEAPFVVEFRIMKPGGEVRFIRSIVEAIKNDKGELVRLSGAAQDVTEQVKATELLRESEARLKTAENMTHVGNWIWDIKANRVSWSEEMFRIMGQAPNYAPSHEESFQLIAPQDKDRTEQWVRECLAEKKGKFIEVRIVRPSGEMRTVVCTSEVLLDEDGIPERMFGTSQDVTDARLAQEESFARQKLESIGTLAGGIAHDFNNLLGGVLAQAELALEEYQAGSSPEEELKRIRDGAIRGSEIVRQLMIYAGKESEALGLVDVSQVAMGMIELLRVSISKHAAVVTDLGPDLPAVRGSAGQIQQIVMNLVTNASEALEDRDGVIRVATRRVNLDRAAAVSKGIAEGDYVQLEVTDTGHGMSLEVQARVFDPFFTTKSDGHGLGLGVVRGIVQDLGGAIHLSSELGKGSTFQIFLRATGIMTGGSGPLPTARDSNPAAMAIILVVEDDDALRVALAQILRRRSFETLDAANGTDAINLLRANSIKIDIMLLDVTIPGPSSHDVATVAAEARPGLKVVLTSAYDEKTVRTKVGAPQNYEFIRKPFQVEELVQTLRNGLSLGTTAGTDLKQEKK